MEQSYETAIALIVIGSLIFSVSVTALMCKHKDKISKRFRSDYITRKRLRRQRRREAGNIPVENRVEEVFVIPYIPPEPVRPDGITVYPEIRTTTGEDYMWDTQYNHISIPGTASHEEYNTQPAYNPAFQSTSNYCS